VYDFAIYFIQDSNYTTPQPIDSLPLQYPTGIIRKYIPWFIQYLGDHVSPKNKKWEIYGEMVERTAQAQPLTAQELDLRNFFQHNQVQFWVHPVWKISEDHCFYVYDFAFIFIPSNTSDIPTIPSKLRSSNSLCDDLWLLECSYTTSKPGNAKHFFRKRSPYIDRKFRAAKRRGMSTVLLLEALHVSPQELRNKLPSLDYADVFFTSVDELKEWILGHIDEIPTQNDSIPLDSLEPTKKSQVPLNGFLQASKNLSTDQSSTNPHSSANKPSPTKKRRGRYVQ
jgi:hypothetical protein